MASPVSLVKDTVAEVVHKIDVWETSENNLTVYPTVCFLGEDNKIHTVYPSQPHDQSYMRLPIFVEFLDNGKAIVSGAGELLPKHVAGGPKALALRMITHNPLSVENFNLAVFLSRYQEGRCISRWNKDQFNMVDGALTVIDGKNTSTNGLIDLTPQGLSRANQFALKASRFLLNNMTVS